MTASPVLVTGATGTVGAAVLRGLADAGVPAVAAVRDPNEAPDLPAAERRRFDFTDPATYDAFDGAERLFLLRPPALSRVERDVNPAVTAAVRAGVRHVVVLSLLGAERVPFMPHRRIEDHVRGLGVAWTFLRPSFFMQNLSTTHRSDIAAEGVIAVPAGSGRTSFVDARDVGDAAVRVLTTPGHAGRAYALTGDEALTYGEVAAVFTRVLGRPVRYTDPSLPGFAVRMLRQGHPLGFVLVTSAIYTVARLGLAATVTPELAALLGRPPCSLATFVDDYRDAWERGRDGAHA